MIKLFRLKTLCILVPVLVCSSFHVRKNPPRFCSETLVDGMDEVGIQTRDQKKEEKAGYLCDFILITTYFLSACSKFVITPGGDALRSVHE